MQSSLRTSIILAIKSKRVCEGLRIQFNMETICNCMGQLNYYLLFLQQHVHSIIFFLKANKRSYQYLWRQIVSLTHGYRKSAFINISANTLNIAQYLGCAPENTENFLAPYRTNQRYICQKFSEECSLENKRKIGMS